MLKVTRRLISETDGQDLAEYGIAMAVIAVGVGAIALAIGGSVSTIWTTAQTAIAAAV